ncbi:hypothetical protein AVEN_4381-1 [Araneus ventricosus]|uniref:Endonuclease/exonuclease/phosphatase domain-containing protein n=1 Tax=Araneus ventricosus TaxID=182803 RepID=A0A4Y2VQQ0_ARAVE|nr:hypothetical protein AVEN_4381-1 [Araneus ventricosus]
MMNNDKLKIFRLTPEAHKTIQNKITQDAKWLATARRKPLLLTFNNQRNNSLNLIIWNAAGIRNKINQLKYFLLDWKPHILALQKTYLNPGDRLKFPNYSSYRTDRLTHRGGGTAILIRNSVDRHPTPIASTTLENTTIEIHLPDSTPLPFQASIDRRMAQSRLWNLTTFSTRTVNASLLVTSTPNIGKLLGTLMSLLSMTTSAIATSSS